MGSTGFRRGRSERGFSLLELVITMGLVLFVLAASAGLLAGVFAVSRREERRSDAVAAARAAVEALVRDLSSAGYQLPPGTPPNGLVAADSGATRLRLLSNHDAFSRASGATPDSLESPDEDVLYRFVAPAGGGEGRLLREDVGAGVGPSVVSDRLAAFSVRYYSGRVTYAAGSCSQGVAPGSVRDASGGTAAEVAPDRARFVLVTACVRLPAVGAPGSPGHQPASDVRLISGAVLRNAP